jgi:hypothetical protein
MDEGGTELIDLAAARNHAAGVARELTYKTDEDFGTHRLDREFGTTYFDSRAPLKSVNGDGNAMQQIITAAIILAAAGFGYVALTGGLDRMNDTSTTVVGMGIILIWLLIIVGRSARLAITAKHKKPIEKSNIVALTIAIFGAVMFFSTHGVILGMNIQFLNIWIAIIGAVVVAIQWVDDYFKQQPLKAFGK